MRRARGLLLLFPLLLVLPTPAAAQPLPAVRCAHDLFDAVGERVWPGWSAAPFGLLLIDGDEELIVSSSAEVTERRKRTLDPHLLATFPAVDGTPTIVVGTPAMTGKSETAWVITLLHEHFHQLQQSQSWYSEKTLGLGLAKGDTTGMWMLNYDFPYRDAAVQARYDRFAHALAAALRARGTVGFTGALREVKQQWRALREALKPEDYAYARFQFWQEGVARYVELTAAREVAALTPRPVCAAGAAEVADVTLQGVLAALDAPKLAERKRVAFYAAGAAIALLLDETSPAWKGRYLEQPFAMETYFAP